MQCIPGLKPISQCDYSAHTQSCHAKHAFSHCLALQAIYARHKLRAIYRYGGRNSNRRHAFCHRKLLSSASPWHNRLGFFSMSQPTVAYIWLRWQSYLRMIHPPIPLAGMGQLMLNPFFTLLKAKIVTHFEKTCSCTDTLGNAGFIQSINRQSMSEIDRNDAYHSY